MRGVTAVFRRKILIVLLTCVGFAFHSEAQVIVSGQLKKWHKVTLTFESSITTHETDSINPFTDYRLDVRFSNGSKSYWVPGYYAADGDAANTGAASGSKWRVHFCPDETGVWTYVVSFRTGPLIAVSDNAAAGTAVASLNGLSGSFVIQPTDKTGRDHRAKGRLRYVGEHHLRFAETAEYFLKAGCNSPENFLAYWEFDGTYDDGGAATTLPGGLHRYSNHVQDWNANDPTWQNGKGKGIIGALNYLASEGINALYFLTMNISGDGDDVWPYISHSDADRLRFDVSKLDQWEMVFSHMDSLGIVLHLVTQERENQTLLDGGALGIERMLYYRELIARFSHHPGIIWNLGEENGWAYLNRGTQNDRQRKEMSSYFKSHDPYQSFVCIHTYTNDLNLIYTPLLGYPDFDGVSMQTYYYNVHDFTKKWIDSSAARGRKWVVNHDETVSGLDKNGPGNNHDLLREKVLWGNYMAGGGGVEWYLGSEDLNAEDFRQWSGMWKLTRYAHQFFANQLPFWKMRSNDNLTSNTADYVLELPGKIYAVYLPTSSGSRNINLPCGSYTVKWFEPEDNTALLNGSITAISGGANVYYGNPPYGSDDWVALITSNYAVTFDVTHTGCDTRGGMIEVTVAGGSPPYSFLWSDGETSPVISDLSVGTYIVTITDNSGCLLIDSVKVVQTSTVSLTLRVLLEGPYEAATGLMRDNLRAAGLLPLTEPYTDLGFVHYGPGGGETTTPDVLSITGNDAIVDWVFVELRSKTNRAAVLATRSALLQRDGDIVDVNGFQPLLFTGIPCDDYHIAIRHRNHLGFMTQNVQPLTSLLSLDFSNTSILLYGTNAQKPISARRAMWAGNCNADKQLKYTGSGNDRDLILSAVGGAATPVGVASGYFREDVNLDGYVKYMGMNNDRDIILVNVGGTNPAGTRTEQLP